MQLDDCEKAGRLKGGILTTASAMGPVLLERLERHGDVRFSISSSVGARGEKNPVNPAQEANTKQSKM